MTLTNCAVTGLETYAPTDALPWDAERVKHLYRRAGFGATPEEIELALLEGPEATVDRMLDDANDRPRRPEPEWAYYDYDETMAAGLTIFDLYVDWNHGFITEALNHGVREKLELFWQNHFVAKYESYSCSSYYYQYNDLITRMAFGDFKEFTKEVTKSPAMLFFLNGFQNTKQDPNENYARELFELFTLGENNGYTQQDIVEASRALTGWNGWTSYCGGVEWAAWAYDSDPKTVFGRTGNFNYAELIDVLFEERSEEIATFICGKLYRYYVNPTIDEDVVAGLAATFRFYDFNVLPVLRQLFKSAHFFDPANTAALIKSPLELMGTWIREGNFGSFSELLNWGFWGIARMGQYLGEQPDVAGWQGNRAWIDSNRLAFRWEMTDGFFWAFYNKRDTIYTDFFKQLTNGSSDVEEITRAVVDYFIPKGLLTEEDYTLATDAFKWQVPANYFTNGTWSLDYPSAKWQTVVLLRHIGRLPEFQLC